MRRYRRRSGPLACSISVPAFAVTPGERQPPGRIARQPGWIEVDGAQFRPMISKERKLLREMMNRRARA